MFYFSEIMIIFLAVMTTDIIMLDTFNTFVLPTSTTVSIVFELLGSAVAMATIKLYMSQAAKDWMHTHTGLIMIYSFVTWTILLQLLNWLFKVNILKTIVLIGTFSLALAFAGNDLVNFIGVLIAGYNAYEVFAHTAGANPHTLPMIALSGKVTTPPIFLLLAGLVMVLTLAFSKKARCSVIKTSVDLSRQDEGDERFKPNAFTASFLVVYAYYYGGNVVVFIFLVVIAYLVYRSHKFHGKKLKAAEKDGEGVYGITDENLIERTNATLISNIKKMIKEYHHTISGLEGENVKELRKGKKVIDEMASRTKYLKNHINIIIERLREESVDTSYYLVEVLDYMREMIHSISFFNGPALTHVDNNHKPLKKEQIEELHKLSD